MKKLIPALLLAPALVWAEPVKVISRFCSRPPSSGRSR